MAVRTIRRIERPPVRGPLEQPACQGGSLWKGDLQSCAVNSASHEPRKAWFSISIPAFTGSAGIHGPDGLLERMTRPVAQLFPGPGAVHHADEADVVQLGDGKRCEFPAP